MLGKMEKPTNVRAIAKMADKYHRYIFFFCLDSTLCATIQTVVLGTQPCGLKGWVHFPFIQLYKVVDEDGIIMLSPPTIKGLLN